MSPTTYLVQIGQIHQLLLFILCSAIHTDTPGRVDKSAVLRSLQSSGESYDTARETLKHVSVDASGKVELEDFVEVRVEAIKHGAQFHVLHSSMSNCGRKPSQASQPRQEKSPCRDLMLMSVTPSTRMSVQSSRIISTW